MSRESAILSALTDEPVSTEALYERVGYAELTRLGLIPYAGLPGRAREAGGRRPGGEPHRGGRADAVATAGAAGGLTGQALRSRSRPSRIRSSPNDELGRVVVARRRDVPADHLDEVRVVGQHGLVVAHLPLGLRREVVRVLGRHVPLLQREPVDVGVEHGVRVHGRLEREAGRAEAAEHRVVEAEVGGPMGRPPLHQADRPGVPSEDLERRERPRPHGRLPLDVGRRRLDLAEDDVDHPVEELLLVGDVVVEGHRARAELVAELAHRQRVDPVARGKRHGGLQHALPAQPRSRLGG